MPIKVPPIREFSRDERRWRIDWLGAVQRNENVPTEPTIEVILSPVKDGVRNPAKEEGVIGADRRKVGIGIGQLPFLRIGSVWHRGRVQMEGSGETFRLTDVLIEPETLSEIVTGQEISTDRYAIPPYLYKVGAAGLRAKCLAIRYNDDPCGIILPAAEAIRFYYAGSTDLSHIAFSGAYEHARESIINTELSGYPEDGLCVLRLRRWLADDDGWTIGRVLSSDVAYEGAKRIHDSVLVATANGVPAYPACDLPFRGKTTWRARGLKIPSGQGKYRYLIFELLRCSAPFPFVDLEVTRDNDGRQADDNTDIPDAEKKPAWSSPGKPPSSANDSTKPLQSDHEPDARLPGVEIPLTRECFDALDGKEVIRHPKEECRYKGSKLGALIAGETDSLGTGQGTYAHTGAAKAKTTIQRMRSKGIPASLTIFVDVAHVLDAMPDIRAKVFRPEVEWLLPLLQPSNHSQWAYLDSCTKVRRGVIAIEICYQGRSAYLIEFEQRISEHRTAALLLWQGGLELNDMAFSKILLDLSRSKGVWNDLSLLKFGVQCTKLKHTWITVEACASSVKERLLALLQATTLKTNKGTT